MTSPNLVAMPSRNWLVGKDGSEKPCPSDLRMYIVAFMPKKAMDVFTKYLFVAVAYLL